MASPRPLPTLRRARVRTRDLLIAAAVVFGSAGSTSTGTAAAGGNAPRLDTRERAVIHRINAFRADHGVARLAFGGRLSRAADRHSVRLLRSRTLTHQLRGEAPLSRRLARAARAKPLGEVIYFTRRGTGSARIVRAWARSPGHRALLLSRDFGRAGIGVRTGRGGVYVTLDFAAS